MALVSASPLPLPLRLTTALRSAVSTLFKCRILGTFGEMTPRLHSWWLLELDEQPDWGTHPLDPLSLLPGSVLGTGE